MAVVLDEKDAIYLAAYASINEQTQDQTEKAQEIIRKLLKEMDKEKIPLWVVLRLFDRQTRSLKLRMMGHLKSKGVPDDFAAGVCSVMEGINQDIVNRVHELHDMTPEQMQKALGETIPAIAQGVKGEN